jgi:hypothetical protein
MRKRGRKKMPGTKAPRKGKTIGAWIPTKAKEVLEELAERNDRSLTSEIMRALRRHFEAEGVEWTREMEKEEDEE